MFSQHQIFKGTSSTVIGAVGASCRWAEDTGRANRRASVGSPAGARPEWLSSTAHAAAAAGAATEQTDTATHGTEWPLEATAAPLLSQVCKLFT